MNNKKIVLENGSVILAKGFGYNRSEVYGSFIFNTSIVGYEEALTDPSYKNEILVMTFPLQGIYGINFADQESKKIHLAAFIVNEYENNYSNNHAQISLNEFLIRNKTLGICDIDTRYLTKIIRDQGSLKGAIVNVDQDTKTVLAKIKQLQLPSDQVAKVSCKQITILNPDASKIIVFYDFGAKNNIKNEFIKRGYKLVVVPYNTKASKVLSYKPEFVFLSNGPGDPETLTESIAEIKKLIAKKTKLVGICLGHQLLALALNAKTKQLKFGHHATNHPVKNLFNNKVYITSQNHNYAVVNKTLPKDVEVFLKSLNDDSIEGIQSKKFNIIATQFHPEAAPGTNDANEIFDLFISFNQSEEKIK